MKTNRVHIQSKLLSWARERSRRSESWFERRFPQLDAWVAGDAAPTLKQLESFASAVHVPLGYLFLREPPVETLPIPDFRTLRNQEIVQPSADLLETIYACQQRQEWYRDFARMSREDPREFVGSKRVVDDVLAAAASIRETIGFDLVARREMKTWEDALRQFIAQAEDVGVLVMVNGIVGTNTHRKLDIEEFRGFALADELAPLVFINGADSKSAQMFTLAHELAHLWLGETAVSDLDPDTDTSNATERWCNRVAAEVLVPIAAFRNEVESGRAAAEQLQNLARVFKVSTIVILRRMLDAGLMSKSEFQRAYRSETERVRRQSASGGNFYSSQKVRLSPRFGRAVIVSTLQGETLYRDAFRMLGVSKTSTFNNLAEHLGVL